MRNTVKWLLTFMIVAALLLASCVPPGPGSNETPAQEETGQAADLAEPGETAEPEPAETEPVVEEPQVEEPEPVEPPVEEPAAGEPPVEEPGAEEPQVDEPEPRPEPEEEEEPFVHKYQELALYALELINRDRVANGLDPVVMGGNSASQTHAEENLAFAHSSHWGVDGSKPYMRYTLAGGQNYVAENVIGTGITSGGSTEERDIMALIEEAEERFMDSPGHRANILNKWHKKVSIGLAYDGDSFHWIQHFEGDYIRFTSVPAVSGTVLSMTGRLKEGRFERIIVYYDPPLQPLTPAQLNAPPYDSTYGLGEVTGNVLPPLPPGSYYTNLGPTDVVAQTLDAGADGSFTVGADISAILARGNGVYTIAVLAEINGEYIDVSNYSIFIP